MTWLYFVAFYLKQDGLPWLGWIAFAGCIAWDWFKERREAAQARAQALFFADALARMEQLLEKIVRSGQ